VTQVGRARVAGNDYAADRLWIETHYPDPRPFGERVTANRRRSYALAILVFGACAAGILLLMPMGSTTAHGSGWTEVSGFALELAGLAFLLRALKRHGVRTPSQVWYFWALNARQRRHLLNQARGHAPAAADEVAFARRLAQRAIAEKARGLEMAVGVGILAIGEAMRGAGTWRWFLLTMVALYLAAFGYGRLRMKEMKNFLLAHPDE
jgi:hypothetical protein